MIISASRRTDIPNYFSDWFMQRIHDGFVYSQNPFNSKQIKEIVLTPDLVDCIVFWTKNANNITKHVPELKKLNYDFIFQYTITCYDSAIEPNVPNKTSVIIPNFIEISKLIGAERMIWRYDPILFNEHYTFKYHIDAFTKIAKKLSGYTNKVIISFLDSYKKIEHRLNEQKICIPNTDEQLALSAELYTISNIYGMTIETCAEKVDLSSVGIAHGSCIDKKYLEEILRKKIAVQSNSHQRALCNCSPSVDIGVYNTCQNNCIYCYANKSPKRITQTFFNNSPLLG